MRIVIILYPLYQFALYTKLLLSRVEMPNRRILSHIACATLQRSGIANALLVLNGLSSNLKIETHRDGCIY